MKRLPPLSALEAFVHAARTGSVKAAAEALALSSPALTRRIQALERHVGHPLFERRHQSIHLNEAGERLLGDVGPALDAIGVAIERASGKGELMRLKLAVLPLFASYQLMPRLSKLREIEPDLHIDIDTRPHALARLDEGLDVAITLTREVEPPLYARRLGANRVVAIGARHLAEGPRALTAPAQLREATVLLHRDLPDAFDAWREAVGLPGLEPAAIDMFDSGQLILNAAAEGLGVAFMFEMHLEGAQDPRLARLFDVAVESPYCYWFACRRSALNRRPVRLFHDWLISELG
ncbi:LysR substrate-binding domain-containing protein [Sphingosinicella sp. CPCC 101087]|uniref:LysR substrate-binding domain-containing protein n=1 Tax=Sphingosinicella sp. CPCC 101087 TaxID=2497754 RepID=UPI00101D9C8F|nr:LysR substrate-binding domain-containing protein [Sphingosinicella sp. CPCC 101087]